MTFYCLKLYSVSVAVVLALGSLRAMADVTVSGAPARPSPEWLRNGTVYEIFPRDFSKAGNLDGVTAKLDELHSLGVNILWTMPIHPIGEKFRKGELGSPYSIKDYYAVDPNYGTVKDYQRMVSEAHKRGMKVIMDLVADHTAWDSVMMQHPEFYKHDAQGMIISPVPAWTDVAALNYDNPALRQYMTMMLEYWIKEATWMGSVAMPRPWCQLISGYRPGLNSAKSSRTSSCWPKPASRNRSPTHLTLITPGRCFQ